MLTDSRGTAHWHQPASSGFAYPANLDPGFPAYRFELPENAPTLAESLRASGYATFAVGKWHLTRDAQSHDAADRGSWPLQRGFDRYFGSLEGLTSLHAPHRLVWDNSPYDVADYGDDYFLTDDLTDRAISMIRTLRANDGAKPFFLYFAHHAVHGPIQAEPADIEKYRGVYDAGWDVVRSDRAKRQIAAGLFGADTPLPSNHEPGKDVPPWDDLSAEQQERFARYMEVYAASVDNVDQNLGRLLDAIESYGELDNTIVVFTSDNGATAEGGADGTRSYFSQFAHVPGLPADWQRDVERDIDLIGGPRTTVHYPRGWGQVSNTPYRLYKSDTLAGGIRAPLIIRWPKGIADRGRDREQYVYVTDLAPTLLELAGVPRLTSRTGMPAMDVDGTSAATLVEDAAAPSRHREQYVETAGNRAYLADGWKIVTTHRPGDDYDDAEWQLYHLADDPTETRDLAAQHPERVASMARQWEHEAWRNAVFPMNDGSPATHLRRPTEDQLATPVTLHPGTPTLERYRAAQLVQLRDFTVTADVDFRLGDRGVLFAHGDQGGGYVVYIHRHQAHLSYNAYGEMFRCGRVAAAEGPTQVVLTAQALPGFRWMLELSSGGDTVALGAVPQLLGMAPFTGISVGEDRGGPVDWGLYERERSFPYIGTLRRVHYEPGKPADYDPREVARLWADAAHVYD